LNHKTLKFSRGESAIFFRTLNKRVNSYFKENDLSRNGNWRLYVKTIAMFALYLGPYALLLFTDMPWWANLLCVLTMGVGMAGVGMNVMHDANH
jgi:linoleoyl-CoA desaturase